MAVALLAQNEQRNLWPAHSDIASAALIVTATLVGHRSNGL
jgi:hypothetical protein